MRNYLFFILSPSVPQVENRNSGLSWTKEMPEILMNNCWTIFNELDRRCGWDLQAATTETMMMTSSSVEEDPTTMTHHIHSCSHDQRTSGSSGNIVEQLDSSGRQAATQSVLLTLNRSWSTINNVLSHRRRHYHTFVCCHEDCVIRRSKTEGTL